MIDRRRKAEAKQRRDQGYQKPTPFQRVRQVWNVLTVMPVAVVFITVWLVMTLLFTYFWREGTTTEVVVVGICMFFAAYGMVLMLYELAIEIGVLRHGI